LIMYEELERNADVFEREQNIVMLEEEWRRVWKEEFG
jgi:hypothetical protein